MEKWLLFAITAGLFSSLFNFGFRYVLKRSNDSSSFSWWFELFRVLIILFILPFNFYIESNTLVVFLLILIGLVEFVSIYFYSKMHRESELSISTIILRLRVVWIPILAFLLTGERLSLVNYVGILIVFIGLSFVSTPKKIFYDKGMLLSLICSIITAVLAVVTKSVSPSVSPAVIIFAMSLPSVILFPFFVKNWKNRAIDFYKKSNLAILVIASASVLAMYFQVKAFLVGSATQVMGIFQATLLVTVLSGIFFLNEKENLWLKIVGSVVTIIGAYLLI